MATEIRVPAFGESVTEATVGRWFKKAGEPVKADEPIVELETDKVTLEVNATDAQKISLALEANVLASRLLIGIVDGDDFHAVAK